ARHSLIIGVVLAATVGTYFATRGGGGDDSSSTPGKPADKKDQIAVDVPTPKSPVVANQTSGSEVVAEAPVSDQGAASKPVVRTAFAAPVEFSFPEDAGGQLLSRKLTPPALSPPDRTIGPRPRAVPRFLENPGLPANKEVASLPRLDAEPK